MYIYTHTYMYMYIYTYIYTFLVSPITGQHLAGTKKVQQLLSDPTTLAKFAPEAEAAALSACFAGLYGLDASGGKAVEEAVAKVRVICRYRSIDMYKYRYRECISACFAGFYGLDASGGKAVEEAVAKVSAICRYRLIYVDIYRDRYVYV